MVEEHSRWQDCWGTRGPFGQLLGTGCKEHAKLNLFLRKLTETVYTPLRTADIKKANLSVEMSTNDSPQQEDKHIVEDTLRLDFMSGIFFRVFENLHCDEHDPARFKLDIMVNTGSILIPDSIKDIKDHCIPIMLDKTFSKTLTLEDIDHFFLTLLNM